MQELAEGASIDLHLLASDRAQGCNLDSHIITILETNRGRRRNHHHFQQLHCLQFDRRARGELATKVGQLYKC